MQKGKPMGVFLVLGGLEQGREQARAGSKAVFELEASERVVFGQFQYVIHSFTNFFIIPTNFWLYSRKEKVATAPNWFSQTLCFFLLTLSTWHYNNLL